MPGIEELPRVDGVSLTREQADAIREYVVGCGVSRRTEQARRFNEGDFIAGAMSVFFAIRQERYTMPWIFEMFSGGVLPKKEKPRRMRP